MILPFRFFDFFALTTRNLQPALRKSFFPAASDLPTSFGTKHVGLRWTVRGVVLSVPVTAGCVVPPGCVVAPGGVVAGGSGRRVASPSIDARLLPLPVLPITSPTRPPSSPDEHEGVGSANVLSASPNRPV